MGFDIITSHNYQVRTDGTRAILWEDDKAEKINSLEILEILKGSTSVEVPRNIDYKRVIGEIKMVALEESARSCKFFFIDLFARIFACFGVRTSILRINEAWLIALNKPVLTQMEENSDEISKKLSSHSTYKQALALIMKLPKDEIAEPFKRYFDACLKYNDDEAAKEALEKSLISFKLVEAGVYDDLAKKYDAWKRI